MKHESSISRRGFIGLGATGALAAGLSLAGCSPSSSSSETGTPNSSAAAPEQDGGHSLFKETNNSESVNYTPGEITETIDCDICVVGMGMSGLAAAVQAANNGDKVVGLEVTNTTGGNGTGVEGVFAVNSSLQKEQNISFDPAEVIATEMSAMQMNTNGVAWARMIHNSADNVDWLIEQGVQFSGMVDDYLGSGIVPGFHWFEGNVASVGYIPPMTERAK